MSQTKEGVVKAMETIRLRYGNEYWVKIGAAGGRKSRGGGFAKNRQLAREAGRRGGAASRRAA